MKLWVDDIRTPPDDSWTWSKSSADALDRLELWFGNDVEVSAMSLDHDLGDDDTTRPIVLWMCEHELWPGTVVVHSANPVGIDWLEGMIERYKP